MAFRLTKKQSEAVIKALDWYYTESQNKPLIISGLAGTGKSTLVKTIVSALGLPSHNVFYCALTGKAVSVLRMKGHMANTIHRTFYNAKPFNKSVFFKKKSTLPGNLQLIIIDEFGMVGDSIVEDILSFGIPVIGLGDHGQLAPLYEKNTYLTEERMDIFLDEVMRSSDESGILTLAMKARNRDPMYPGTYGDSRVITNKRDLKDFTEYNMIICWTNKTRRMLNLIIRNKIGIESKYPTKGERIFFLQNRYDKMIHYKGIDVYLVNGLEAVMIEDASIVDDHRLRIKARPSFIPKEAKVHFDLEVSREVFDGYHEQKRETRLLMEIAREMDDDVVFCDFSWVITTHSSQGSEAAHCLVIDEYPKGKHDYPRWMYTAITRAAKSVDILLEQSERL